MEVPQNRCEAARGEWSWEARVTGQRVQGGVSGLKVALDRSLQGVVLCCEATAVCQIPAKSEKMIKCCSNKPQKPVFSVLIGQKHEH